MTLPLLNPTSADDEPVVTIPASGRKRGRWGIHKLFYRGAPDWPESRKATLEEAVSYLIGHWEDD